MKLRHMLPALVCAVMLLGAAAAEAAGPYKDLDEGHWAYATMDRAVKMGILSGMGDGVMAPNEKLTWGQYLTLVSRTFDRETYDRAREEGLAWDEAGLQACTEMGLMEPGFTEDPAQVLAQPVTRQDVVLLLDRLLPESGMGIRYYWEEDPFDPPEYTWVSHTAEEKLSDLDELDELHRAAVENLFYWEVVSGRTDGTFSGGDNILRCDGTVLLMKTLEKIDGMAYAEPKTVTLRVVGPDGEALIPDQQADTHVGAWAVYLLDRKEFPELHYYHSAYESYDVVVSVACGTYTLVYEPMDQAERNRQDFEDMVERGEATWEDEWKQPYHRTEMGENYYKRDLLFGSTEKRRFSSQAEAQAAMTTVTFPIWQLDKKGNKTSSTARLTVHSAIADDVVEIFTEIYNDPEQFPIQSLSGFRFVAGTNGEHNCGTAIDINPTQNYQVRDGKALVGSYWKPGEDPWSMPADGSVIRIFAEHGWAWGGDAWLFSQPDYHDYMHFSYMGG